MKVVKRHQLNNLRRSYFQKNGKAVEINKYITLFQEGDIYITIVNHDGPQNNRNNITNKQTKKYIYIYILCKKITLKI